MQKTEAKPIKNKEIASGYRAEQRFCYMSSKTQAAKTKIGKWDYIKEI